MAGDGCELATSTKLGRRFLERFIKNKEGSTAIEFALLALPFTALVFAIIESSIAFTAHQVTANAVEDVARDIRTNVLPAGANIRDLICARMQVLVAKTCPDLYIDLGDYAKYDQVPLTLPFNPVTGDLDSSGFGINRGGPGSIQQLRVFYKWPYYTDYIAGKLAQLPDGKTLIFATLTWQNEQFQAAAPPPVGP
ncbi:MAG: TadE/TadG family type IV pilus assembly protein [Rhizobiaceae bacterium]